jgi:hypothetical protein
LGFFRCSALIQVSLNEKQAATQLLRLPFAA